MFCPVVKQPNREADLTLPCNADIIASAIYSRIPSWRGWGKYLSPNFIAARPACTIAPTAWYSKLESAPDDERVIRSKHVEQEKTVE